MHDCSIHEHVCVCVCVCMPLYSLIAAYVCVCVRECVEYRQKHAT